ncbi:hypothetical protein ElyMa_001292600 [Elysia marginata]|uniref:Uncharacterized protein n=1 Tax=Elysia marginata TaxID=1093978 RepID=A0AAV4IKD0_9GAST|nr:hypothetical protein ElyMa_001292600 [Elysia marginata]
MLTEARPVVYDCILTTTTWLYPHIASAAKQANPLVETDTGKQQSTREEGHATKHEGGGARFCRALSPPARVLVSPSRWLAIW